jgi:hydrogenase expression/formation protein HypD
MIKFLDEYRDPALAQHLVKKIRNRAIRGLRFMEFCGGHTVAIMKYGLRQLLFPQVELLSGPGCPVCVTATVDIDKAIALAKKPEIILTTFGDMLKVPGSCSSLQKVRAEGGDIRIVYSAQDALEIAQENPDKKVVFLGIGFETTAPTIAASIREAKSRKIENYYVLSLHKLCPPVIKALLDSGEIKLDGIILPGHVSAIIGSYPYEFISRDYGIGGVVAGF